MIAPVPGRDGEGVFLRIKPSAKGATVFARLDGESSKGKALTQDTVEDILKALPLRFEVAKTKMVRTEGSRTGAKNPKWTRDELILALDLYFKQPPWKVSGKHPAFAELSQELGQLAAYENVADQAKYRNANGVYMKMMNLQFLDPSRDGRGLKGGGALEQEVWDEYAGDQAKLALVAAGIRAGIKSGVLAAPSLLDLIEESGMVEAVEGRVQTVRHLQRERASGLAAAKKQRVLKQTGRLDCEVCKFNFQDRYGQHGADFAEVHHLLPLAALHEETKTRLADLAVLCANCHRMIHRRKKYLTLHDLRLLLQSSVAEG